MQLAKNPPPQARPTPPWHGIVAAILGTLAAVIGTFLPWLHSGLTTRNVYAAAAIWQQFISSSDIAIAQFLPWLGAVLLIPMVMGVMGYLRIAAATALLLSAVVLTATIIVAVEISTRARLGVSLSTLGPTVVGAGTIFIMYGAITVLRTTVRR